MYRNKKLASHTIELILKDIQEISQSYNLSIQTLQILVPSNSPLEDYLLRHGYQEIENTEIIIRGGITHRYLEQYRS